MKGWIDLFVNRILPEVVGETAAPFVFGMLLVLVALYGCTPFLIVWMVRQLANVRSTLAATNAQLERMTLRGNETHTMVKDSFALVQDRLAGVPPPTRFGPDGEQKPVEGGAPAGAPAAPVSTGDGQGSYNYCGGCKEIRFIKFFRCQTCGFHVPK